MKYRLILKESKQNELQLMKSLYNNMKDIDYGFMTKEGKIVLGTENHTDDEWMELYDKHYILLSPDEVFKYNIGVCWDQTELERKYCIENNIPHICYYISNDRLETHTWLMFKHMDQLFWFEHSWYNIRGIHGPYKSFKEFFNTFLPEWNKENLKNKWIKVWEYPKPKYHITCEGFMNNAMRNGTLVLKV